MTKKCLQCDKEFTKPQTESLKNWNTRHKYCSRQCVNLAQLGKKLPESTIAKLTGRSVWNKGVSPSASTRQKLSLALKGRPLSEATKEKMRGRTPWNKGKIWFKTKFKKNPVTPKNNIIRRSPRYRRWREEVFKRDDYTCKSCYERGGKLNADHIKSFSKYPELRFELSNGRTLCEPCHKNTPSYGRG